LPVAETRGFLFWLLLPSVSESLELASFCGFPPTEVLFTAVGFLDCFQSHKNLTNKLTTEASFAGVPFSFTISTKRLAPLFCFVKLRRTFNQHFLFFKTKKTKTWSNSLCFITL
jgi:hypothetical protein